MLLDVRVLQSKTQLEVQAYLELNVVLIFYQSLRLAKNIECQILRYET